MSKQKIFFVFILLTISIVVAERDRKKICIHNLTINGTNLLLSNRKLLLVVGIVNFNNQSARIQANRFNDLLRELQHVNIRDSVVKLILINEQNGVKYYPGSYYDKIRIFQDNSKDHLIKKINQRGGSLNNYVFGRCGYLIFTQEHPNSNLDNGKNYQDLLRTITTAVKNKRRCQGLCS